MSNFIKTAFAAVLFFAILAFSHAHFPPFNARLTAIFFAETFVVALVLLAIFSDKAKHKNFGGLLTNAFVTVIVAGVGGVCVLLLCGFAERLGYLHIAPRMAMGLSYAAAGAYGIKIFC